jgi:hypothetical protein
MARLVKSLNTFSRAAVASRDERRERVFWMLLRDPLRRLEIPAPGAALLPLWEKVSLRTAQ